ncbi:MAG: ATP-binding protein [Methanobacterium sp.]|uniref:ATP-binding protein n=1 Tax=Methanobacterium sp. TaxID=2164 RepID=UPI003D64B05B|nr:ATP-binding protein [Methanobacterium sp.]
MKLNFQLETDAKLENLAMIADFIFHSMNDFDLDEKTVHQIQIAVDEACTNIINHAYPQKKGKIHIICFKKEEQILIVIEDWGKSWDPQSVKPPDLKSGFKERQIGGLGIHFIKTFMDHVKYHEENGKNVLTMIKSFNSKIKLK